MTVKPGTLGPLQQTVLDFVWENPASTVRHCLDKLNTGDQKRYAYTTIQTVFDVLHRKGLVVRRRKKNAYYYTAKESRALFLTERLGDVLRRFGKMPVPIASSLVDALEESDPAEINLLITELRNRGHID